MLTKCYWLDAPHERVMIGVTKVLIGRSPDCAIVLEGPQVSRWQRFLAYSLRFASERQCAHAHQRQGRR